MINKIFKALLVLVLLVLSLVLGMFIYVYSSVDEDVQKVINYTPDISSEIVDRNGKRISYIFRKQHRLYAKYNEIPINVVEGLVATEDTKFFEHNGINLDTIARAAIKDIMARKFVEGGSTITQQLIKNMFLSSQKKLSRKMKEAILAIKLEKRLSKEQIIERYLNKISYGNNYLGIKTASEGYFRKDLKALSLKESAMLVGIPNAPSFYNPLRHYERALKRANLILRRLKKLGWITETEYKKAQKERPKIYKTSLSQNIAPYIVDEVIKRLNKKFPNLKTAGYKIYTTIDLEIQNIAKKSIKNGLENILKRIKEDSNSSDLNGALIAIENNTGNILAMVSGVDYKKSNFNRVTMTKRQPGSSFKPFIYQTALDLGYSLATKLTDLARTFKYKVNGKEKIWAPQNYEQNFMGFVPLREALVESINLATLNLVQDLGVEKIRSRLTTLGIKNIPQDLSISLGNLALSPLEMAKIYTVFSNYGHMIEPKLINKIISKYNTAIYETKPKEIADFTKPEQAYLMTTILKDVIKRGTGKNARVEGLELAGKTGTTNNYIDAWFCGYSPDITTIIWYGRDQYKTIFKGATGGKIVAPVFSEFYKKLLEQNPKMKKNFKTPSGVFVGKIDGKKELYTKISPLPKQNRNIYLYEEGSFSPYRKKSNDKEQKNKNSNIIEILNYYKKSDSNKTINEYSQELF